MHKNRMSWYANHLANMFKVLMIGCYSDWAVQAISEWVVYSQLRLNWEQKLDFRKPVLLGHSESNENQVWSSMVEQASENWMVRLWVRLNYVPLKRRGYDKVDNNTGCNSWMKWILITWWCHCGAPRVLAMAHRLICQRVTRGSLGPVWCMDY